MVKAKIVAANTQRCWPTVHAAPRAERMKLASHGLFGTAVMRVAAPPSNVKEDVEIAMQAIKTIGQSNDPLGRFVDLLKAGGVTLLVDVRSRPTRAAPRGSARSRWPGAWPRPASLILHQGAALGGKPDGGGSYDALTATQAFKDALGRVIERAQDTTLCLMCAEKEPIDCHRTVLLSRRLAEQGIAINHLLADGSTRPHREVEDALLAGKGGPDLFEDRPARLARAYRRRRRRRRWP